MCLSLTVLRRAYAERMHRENLISMKKRAGRPQDLLDITEFENIRARQKRP